MEFKELIEARRSVRKYVPGEISKAEVVTSVIALGKAAGAVSKPPRKPAGEILKIG